MIKIAILASGNGTNAENIIRYFQNSNLAKVVLVLTNKPNAKVIERAQNLNVPVEVLTNSELSTPCVLPGLFMGRKIDLIILAGYLRIIPESLIRIYRGRIINIHPSLLPKFGGMGMYGHHVHKAVKEAGEKVTGFTVHHVTGQVDEGSIIAQKKVDLSPEDTVEDIAEKEHILEMKYFPTIIEEFIRENIIDNYEL